MAYGNPSCSLASGGFLAGLAAASVALALGPAGATLVPAAGICLLAAVWLILEPAGWQPADAAMAAVPVLWAAWAAVVAHAPGPGAIEALAHWLAIGLTWGGARALFRKPGVARAFRRGAPAVAIGLCALSTLQFFTSGGRLLWIWPSGQPAVLGPFLSRNNYCSFVLVLFPLLLDRAQASRWRPGWVAGAALLFGSVIASGSRAGAGLIAVELLLYTALQWRASRSGSMILAAAGLAAVGSLVMGWEALDYKLRHLDLAGYRLPMLQSTLDMIAAAPGTGHGLGSFPFRYPEYARFDSGYFVNHAHNHWAEWAAEGGLPFLLLPLAFFVWATIGSLRKPWALGIPAVGLHALVDYPFARLGVVLWVIAAAALLSSEPTDVSLETK